jgi:hypothetical protein
LVYDTGRVSHDGRVSFWVSPLQGDVSCAQYYQLRFRNDVNELTKA